MTGCAREGQNVAGTLRAARSVLTLCALFLLCWTSALPAAAAARGHLQEELGRLAAAEAGYLEGLAHLQHVRALGRELIRIKIALGRYPEALTLIDKELASASVKTEWYLRRARVLAAMGQAEAGVSALTQALAEANRAFAQRPTALHRLARAKIYQALEQLEVAKQDLLLAVQTAPRFKEADEFLKTLETQ